MLGQSHARAVVLPPLGRNRDDWARLTSATAPASCPATLHNDCLVATHERDVKVRKVRWRTLRQQDAPAFLNSSSTRSTMARKHTRSLAARRRQLPRQNLQLLQLKHTTVKRQRTADVERPLRGIFPQQGRTAWHDYARREKHTAETHPAHWQAVSCSKLAEQRESSPADLIVLSGVGLVTLLFPSLLPSTTAHMWRRHQGNSQLLSKKSPMPRGTYTHRRLGTFQ